MRKKSWKSDFDPAWHDFHSTYC